MSPAATLERGYAIVRTADGTIARDATQFTPGARLDAQLAHGRVGAVVDEVRPEE